MSAPRPRHRVLHAGEPAPWFRQRVTGNPDYRFDTAAGRWIVLCFFATAADRVGQEALRLLDEHRALFDDVHASFFGVSLDPRDETEGRVGQRLPGIRMIWDFDGVASAGYGVIPIGASPGEQPVESRRLWFILDPLLRIRAIIPFDEADGGRGRVAAAIARLPPVARYAGIDAHPPILVLTDVFERAFCRDLVALYDRHGGEDSGFMREVNGKTVGLVDYTHKRRSDHVIVDEAIIEAARARIAHRVAPEIRKAYQFEATRMERHIVACYEAATGGHFRPHRDNTTRGTAHRRFAVSINLNDDFAGGEIMFPEYGPRRYKAPAGAAVVFSCSILHQVVPVTAGRRFVFLPFLYDDAAARIRELNNPHLGEGVVRYEGARTASA